MQTTLHVSWVGGVLTMVPAPRCRLVYCDDRLALRLLNSVRPSVVPAMSQLALPLSKLARPLTVGRLQVAVQLNTICRAVPVACK